MVLIPFNRLEAELVKYSSSTHISRTVLYQPHRNDCLYSCTGGLKEAREKDKFLLRRESEYQLLFNSVSAYLSFTMCQALLYDIIIILSLLVLTT